MGRVSSSTLMGTTMKETGAITKLVGTASTFMKTETSTRENGRTMSSTAMVKNDGLMAPATKVHTTKEQSTGLVCISGMTALSTMGTGTTMLLRALASTHGLMEENIEESGRTQI